MSMSPFGGGAMFTIVPAIIVVMFVVVLGIILFNIINGISEWHNNNQQDVSTFKALVVAKRADVSHHSHTDGHL